MLELTSPEWLGVEVDDTVFIAPVDHPKSVTLASAQSLAYELISKAGIAANSGTFGLLGDILPPAISKTWLLEKPGKPLCFNKGMKG